MDTKLDMDALNKLCEDFLYNKELPYDGYYYKSSYSLTSKTDKSLIPQTVIGQGKTLITPLHNAMIMCTIANGGVLMKPYMMDRIENCDGSVVKKFSKSSYGRIISAKEAQTLTDLMRSVTDYGTASDYFKLINHNMHQISFWLWTSPKFLYYSHSPPERRPPDQDC